MDLSEFAKNREEPVFASLDELFSKAELSDAEIGALRHYEPKAKYWLLRLKLDAVLSMDGSPCFVQRLARVLNNLRSPKVTGPKDSLVTEMFGARTVHRCYKTKNGVRSTISSNKIYSSYFELKLISFFLEHGFEIKICKSRAKGEKIAEFAASRAAFTVHVEAKQLDVDKVLDHIHGDFFVDGMDSVRTDEDRAQGHKKIRSMIEKNYDNAMAKFNYVPQNSSFVVFLSLPQPLGILGPDTAEYFGSLPARWGESFDSRFVGVVLLDSDHTYMIQNPNCAEQLEGHLSELLNVHRYCPTVVD